MPNTTAKDALVQGKLFESPSNISPAKHLDRASNTAPARNLAPIARHTDPQTSHLAAQAITASGVRDSQKRELLAWMRRDGATRTSMEIAIHGNFDRYTVARRLPDLRRDGFVRQCEQKICTITGRPACGWRAL